MRTLVDIPEPDVKALDAHGRRQGKSRASLIREAVGEFLRRRPDPLIAEAFGLWRREGEEPVDGVEYQRRLRAEW